MIFEFVFLAVSCVGTGIQCAALARQLRQQQRSPSEQLVHRGCVRTAACRVGAAVAYVVLAVFTLAGSDVIAPFPLAVYSGVQIVWWVNSLLDVRLRRRLAEIEGQPGPGDTVQV